MLKGIIIVLGLGAIIVSALLNSVALFAAGLILFASQLDPRRCV